MRLSIPEKYDQLMRPLDAQKRRYYEHLNAIAEDEAVPELNRLIAGLFAQGFTADEIREEVHRQEKEN